jgi:hypothetical protein
MAEQKEYLSSLSEALLERKDWLEKSELDNLKEELRIYQSSFASLYSIFLRKKLVSEDPYKQETKIGELEVPPTGAFNEAKRVEEISLRLSNFDSQMDFLVNFYQFGVDFLNLERIKRILGLARFIDWSSLPPDAATPNTRVVAEITQQSKTGLDPIALSVIGEALTRLPRSTAAVIGILKNLTGYHKESYKLSVRNAITQNMTQAEANTANIRKKFAAALPGYPFYQEFIEEIIKEDYSGDGPELKTNILNSLKVAVEKPKAVKPVVSFKPILLDGIRAIGSVTATLAEIAVKMDENENLLANQKKGFWEKIRIAFRQMMNNEPEERIIDIEFMDPAKGTSVRQKLNLSQFRTDLDKKVRAFSGMTVGGSAASRLEAMSEEQLISFLERAIREIQIIHRTLGALDEFFKAEAPRQLRDRIKGIRPE